MPTPGLVGRADRSGRAAGHRPVLRRLRQRPRRLPGDDGSVVPRAGRRPVGLPLPRGDRRRPGAGRGGARRRAGHRPVGLRRRRLDGRHAGAGVGGRDAGAGRERCSSSPRVRSASADQIGTQTTQQAAIRADPRWARWRLRPRPTAGRRPGRRPADRAPHLPQRLRAGRAVRRRACRTTAASPSPPTSTTTPTSWPRRFDAGSYVLLTEAMNTWDVGRGRGGVEAALRRVTARSVVAGVDSDRLYPLGAAAAGGRRASASRCR